MTKDGDTVSLEREELIPLFSTPLMLHKWPDVDALNRQLRDLILERERTTTGRNLSNVGGWQSDLDFHGWAGEAGKAIVDRTNAMVNHATAKVLGAHGLKQKIRWGISLWANVNRRGHYNMAHCHPDATWSCVYYVDCGDVDPNNDKSGVITFLSPNAASGVSFFTETVGNKFNVWPESGLMLVVPSYLTHMVHPYTGERPRVSIALNYQLLRGPRPGAPG